METADLKIFEEFRPHAEPGMLEDIRLFLGIEEGVSECRIEADDSQDICEYPIGKVFLSVGKKYIFTSFRVYETQLF